MTRRPRATPGRAASRHALGALLFAFTLATSGCIGSGESGRSAGADGGPTAPQTPMDLGVDQTNASAGPDAEGADEPVPGNHAFTANGSLRDTLLVGYWYSNQDDGSTQEGVDHRDHPLPIVGADADGAAAGATRVHVAVRGQDYGLGHTQQNYNLYLFAPDGRLLAKSGDDECDALHPVDCVESTDENGPETIHWETEPLPPGEYVIRVILYFGAGADYPYHLEWAVKYSYR